MSTRPCPIKSLEEEFPDDYVEFMAAKRRLTKANDGLIEEIDRLAVQLTGLHIPLTPG